MKKALIFVLVLALIAVSCSIFAFADDFNLTDYMEFEDFYLYIPKNYQQYIAFSNDNILFFSSSGTVTCVLVPKDSSIRFRVSFPTIYTNYSQSSSSNSFTNLSQYYANSVTCVTGSGQQQTTITLPVLYAYNILHTDLLGVDRSELYLKLIFILSFVSYIYSVYMIFSKKRSYINV